MSLERYSFYKRNHAAAERDAAYLRDKGIRASAAYLDDDGFLFVDAFDRSDAVRLLDPEPGPKKQAWPDPKKLDWKTIT